MSKTLVCFVEGQSDKIFLTTLIDRIKDRNKKRTKIICRNLGGYDKLKKKIYNHIQEKLQTLGSNSLFLIMIDQDNEHDCKKRKEDIRKIVDPSKNKRNIKIRVACHELESFYLGDLNAVKEGLNIRSKTLSQRQTKKLFNNPDDITDPVKELEKLTGSINKKEFSKVITPYLKIDGTNKSHSFNVLVTAIEHLL